MANTYDRGNSVRVFATFTSTGGSVADPSSVKLKYAKPGSTETVLTYSTGGTDIVRISTGAYRSDIIVDKEGEWTYQWYSTGTVRAFGEKNFRVRPGLV